MIRSFDDKETERVWSGERSRKLPPDIQQTARRKMRALNRVPAPHQLAIPRGNRLEELKGDRKGTYSIRINDQWRITFRFVDGDAYDVRIEDYHRG
jgi:proteic killer suppression protein